MDGVEGRVEVGSTVEREDAETRATGRLDVGWLVPREEPRASVERVESTPRIAGGVNSGGPAVMNDEPIRGTPAKPEPSIVRDPRGSDAPATRGSRRPTLASVTAERARPDAPPRIATIAPELETTMLPVVADVPVRVEALAPDDASETTGASDDAPAMVRPRAPEAATVRAGRLTGEGPPTSRTGAPTDASVRAPRVIGEEPTTSRQRNPVAATVWTPTMTATVETPRRSRGVAPNEVRKTPAGARVDAPIRSGTRSPEPAIVTAPRASGEVPAGERETSPKVETCETMESAETPAFAGPRCPVETTVNAEGARVETPPTRRPT